MEVKEFVQSRRQVNKPDRQIISEMDTVIWALNQGYRKPLEGWNEDMESLFYRNLTVNKEE